MSKDTARVVTHPFRFLLIASFLIALPTNAAASAILYGPFPIFGLLPLGLSALGAICFVVLPRYVLTHKIQSLASASTTAAIAFAADWVCLIGLTVVLALTWSYAAKHWFGDSTSILLVVYATAPMLFSFLVHSLLVMFMIATHRSRFLSGDAAAKITDGKLYCNDEKFKDSQKRVLADSASERGGETKAKALKHPKEVADLERLSA